MPPPYRPVGLHAEPELGFLDRRINQVRKSVRIFDAFFIVNCRSPFLSLLKPKIYYSLFRMD